MSLKHILLGMLKEPTSGYDVKKCLNGSLRHFWAAELSQIYPQLSAMEKAGLLRSRASASERGPTRKLYWRTAKGTRELKQWLTGGPFLNEERRHFLAQVFFLDAIGDEKAVDFMCSLRDLMSEKLESLRASEQAWRERDPRFPDELPDEGFYPYLTLELGKKIFATYVSWCEECLERMEARRTKAAATGSTKRA